MTPVRDAAEMAREEAVTRGIQASAELDFACAARERAVDVFFQAAAALLKACVPLIKAAAEKEGRR